MSISNITLGPNTRQISISNEYDFTNLIDSVSEFLVNKNWTLVDSLNNTFGLITKVYKATNEDQVTFKFLILRWNTVLKKMHPSACGDWNLNNHVPINETASFGASFPIPFQNNVTDFIVIANERFAIFTSFINNDNAPWAGIGEYEPIHPVHIADTNISRFGYFNSWTLGANNSETTTSVNHQYLFCPVYPDGRVGIANDNQNMSIPGYTGPVRDTISSSNNCTYSVNEVVSRKMMVHNSKWESLGKTPMYEPNINFNVDTFNSSYEAGSLIGFKLSESFGNFFNKVKIKVDERDFMSSTGIEKDHWILPIQNKVNGTGNLGIKLEASAVVESISSYSFNGICGESIGDYLYIADQSGIHKISTIGLSKSLLLANTSIRSSTQNNNYIYFVAGTEVIRINTIDDTISNLVLPEAGRTISCDAKNIYVSTWTGSANIVLYKIDIATFSLTQTVTNSIGAGTHTVTALTPDYKGYFFGFITLLNATFNNVFSMNSIDNSIRQGKFTANVSPGQILYYPSLFIDYVTDRIGILSVGLSSTSGIFIDFNASLFKIGSGAVSLGAGAGIGSNYCTPCNLDIVRKAYPIAGRMVVSSGTYNPNAGNVTNLTIYQTPAQGNIFNATLPEVNEFNRSTAIISGYQPGQIISDGVRLFQLGWGQPIRSLAKINNSRNTLRNNAQWMVPV